MQQAIKERHGLKRECRYMAESSGRTVDVYKRQEDDTTSEDDATLEDDTTSEDSPDDSYGTSDFQGTYYGE